MKLLRELLNEQLSSQTVQSIILSYYQQLEKLDVVRHTRIDDDDEVFLRLEDGEFWRVRIIPRKNTDEYRVVVGGPWEGGWNERFSVTSEEQAHQIGQTLANQLGQALRGEGHEKLAVD